MFYLQFVSLLEYFGFKMVTSTFGTKSQPLSSSTFIMKQTWMRQLQSKANEALNNMQLAAESWLQLNIIKRTKYTIYSANIIRHDTV